MVKRSVSILAIVLAGAALAACEEADAEPEADVTAYVLAYHWGFALFDEEGRELEKLEVPQGSTVALVAVNDHAFDAINELPQPVANAMLQLDLHARVREDIEQGLIRDPAEYGMSLERELAQVEEDADDDLHHDHDHGEHAHYLGEGHEYAHRDTYMDHGLRIPGYDVEIERIPFDAPLPNLTVFDADREGTFQFECTQSCGFGHPHPREMLAVR